MVQVEGAQAHVLVSCNALRIHALYGMVHGWSALWTTKKQVCTHRSCFTTCHVDNGSIRTASCNLWVVCVWGVKRKRSACRKTDKMP